MVVNKIIRILENNGFEANYVGGIVRDRLLGIESFDEDLVTNASVEEMIPLFRGNFKSIDEVGKRFGVLIVDGVEIAQYRTEVYNNILKPDVKLTRSLVEDSKRRDFTVNSIYMKLDGTIIDPQNGRVDINNKIIRAVGNPQDRFEEDPSRIFRGMYLASKLGFSIDKDTATAMTNNKHLLSEVPNELKGKIVLKSIKSGTFYGFIKLVMELDVMEGIFPELAHLKDMKQNPKYHKYDAWNHTLEVVKSAENKRPGDVAFILGALFHDNAKGLSEIRKLNKENQPSDIGHESYGSPIAESAVLRIGLGKDIAKKVKFLVEFHGVRFELNCKNRSILRWLRKISSDFNKLEDLKTNVYLLLDFVDSDADGFNDDLKIQVKNMVTMLNDRLDDIFKSHLFYVNQLPVSGKDIISKGIIGQRVGGILNDLVILNIKDRDRALELIKKWSN